MNKTDEQLVQNYFFGDETAFNEIINRYLKPIYNFSYRLTGNKHESEDISQEVFLKTWKNIKKFDVEKSFKTWIFSIAKNTIIDHLRKKKDIPMSIFDNNDGGNIIEDNLKDNELKADELFLQTENKKQIEKILEELSVVQKEVIILKYANEMSLSEVAEIMNIPIDTAKSHYRRALIKMRKSLNAPKLSK